VGLLQAEWRCLRYYIKEEAQEENAGKHEGL
jgi:hypothetical protein